MHDQGRNDSKYNNPITEYKWQRELLDTEPLSQDFGGWLIQLAKFSIWLFSFSVVMVIFYFMVSDAIRRGSL